MAASVLTLIVTAFAPILDWKFEWVTPHWIAGVVLTALVLVHIVRALFFQSPMDMMITPTDVKATLHVSLKTFGKLDGKQQKPGKYSLMQKAYHLGVAVLILIMIGTGFTMFAKMSLALSGMSRASMVR